MRRYVLVLAAAVAASDTAARFAAAAGIGFAVSAGSLGFGPITFSLVPLLWPFPCSRVLYAAAGFVCCLILLLFERRASSTVFQIGRWLALGGIATNYLGWALLGSAVDYIWIGQSVATNAADLAAVAGLALYGAALVRRAQNQRLSSGRGEVGYVLAGTLFVVAILVTLAAAVTTTAFTSVRSARAWHDRVVAFYAADSGINEALYRLIELKHNPADFESASGLLGDHESYSVSFQDLGGGRWAVVSTGRAGSSTRRVRLEVRFVGEPLFPEGRAITETTPGRPYYVEGYEPPAVTFTFPPVPPGAGPGEELEVRNNRSAEIGPGTYWYTGITVGNNSSLTVAGPAEIHVTGDVKFDNNAGLSVSGAVTFYIHGGLTMGTNAQTALSGPTHFFVGEHVWLGNNFTLTTQADARFTVTGNLTLDKNAVLNWPQQASKLVFMLTTDRAHTVTLSNNAQAAAGIYAPTAAVTLENNSRLKGAVVGSTVDLGNNSDVTYDPSLEDVGAPEGSEGRWEAVGGTWSAS
jgi:hypothetical protein